MLVQLVEHDANTAVSFEISIRKEAGKYVREAYCHNKIQQVKGPQFPPVRQLTKFNVIPLRIKAKGEIRFRVQNLESFCPSRSIYVNGRIGKFLSVDHDVIRIEQNQAMGEQGPIHVQQRHEMCDDEDLHRAFARNV